MLVKLSCVEGLSRKFSDGFLDFCRVHASPCYPSAEARKGSTLISSARRITSASSQSSCRVSHSRAGSVEGRLV